MPPAPLNRRDHQKLETRELLVDTGLREFAEHGLDAPSIRGICARAGLTRGAFYVHFEDRDEFLVAVLDRALRNAAEELPRRGVLDGEVEETLELVTRVIAELSRRAEARHDRRAGPGLRFHHLLAGSDRSAAVRARFRSILEDAHGRLSAMFSEGQASGRVRNDLPADDLAHHFVTQALGVLAFVSAGIPVEADRAVRTATALLTPPTGWSPQT